MIFTKIQSWRTTGVVIRGMAACLVLFGSLITLTSCGDDGPLTAQIISPNDGASFTTRSVSFTAADAGENASYIWDFGDGSAELTSDQRAVSHTYNEIGPYTVSLRVSRGNRESEPVTLSITIEDAVPEASLSATPTSGPAPLQVQFSSSGSGDLEGPITEEYDFGDGARGGPGGTVRHTYSEPGTYTATLIVRDSAGQSSTDSITIAVGEQPRTRLWEVRMVATDDGSFEFEPPVLKINPGDTVEWVNVNQTHSTTAYSTENNRTHGIPENGPSWNSGILSNANERWSFTFPFDTPEGTYPYYCMPHEFTGQVGIIVVGSYSELSQAFLDSLQGLALDNMRAFMDVARSR